MMDGLKRILGFKPQHEEPLPQELVESFHHIADETAELEKQVRRIERDPDAFEAFVTAMRKGYSRNAPDRR